MVTVWSEGQWLEDNQVQVQHDSKVWVNQEGEWMRAGLDLGLDLVTSLVTA